MFSKVTVDISHIPRREDLLAQLRTANRWGLISVLMQAFGIVIVALLIDWERIKQESILTTVAIAAVVGPFAMSIMQHLAQKKKELGELQEQTRFGEFDKHRLRKLFDETLHKLGLPEQRIPVYIVADKFTNAVMLHVGLGWILRSLNGIYLNRQALHKLNSEEVQDLMGHELGHYYCYYILSDRFKFVTLTLGALISILIVQNIGLNHLLGYLVLSVCTTVLWTIVYYPQSKYAWSIEFLCDDLGARVNGVEVSVAGLMKLGAEAELVTAIQQQAAISAHTGKLNPNEIAEAIQAAIPYGHATREELEVAVQKSLKLKAEQGPSLAGLLRYMWQGDLDEENAEEFEQEMQKLNALRNVPRLQWETLLAEPDQIRFDEYSLETLVQMIEQRPHEALFLTAEALGEVSASHPTLKQRILYLWYNRREIEQLRHRAR